MRKDLAELDVQLIEAHAKADHISLVELYKGAAEAMDSRGDIDAACFYLTQAYVFALELGHPSAQELHSTLKERGREE